jgi:hypothetical protein
MTKTTTKTTQPATSEGSGVVLFGLDESGKPRAARFGSQHAELATKAAGAMALTVCPVSSAALAEIAEKLPVGRIHANGRGFVPNVRRDLYAKLVEAAAANNGGNGHGRNGHRKEKQAEGASEPKQPARGPQTEPAAPPVAQGYPKDWQDLTVGHLVLATEGGGGGWWEAIVIGVEGDMVTMRWRDYQGHPKLVQHRAAVALMKPSAS